MDTGPLLGWLSTYRKGKCLQGHMSEHKKALRISQTSDSSQEGGSVPATICFDLDKESEALPSLILKLQDIN